MHGGKCRSLTHTGFYCCGFKGSCLSYLHIYHFVESIVEAALCKSVLKPLREHIYQSLEKLHSGDSSLKQLAQNQVGQELIVV